MRKHAILSSIILLSSIISTQSPASVCGQDRLLFPKQTLLESPGEIEVVSNKSEVSKKNNYQLRGNASVTLNKYYLAADQIHIQKNSKILNAIGNVRFQNDELMLTAGKALVTEKDGSIHTSLHQIDFHYPALKINGYAKKITNNSTEQVFDSATYTLCPLGNRDWVIKTDKIVLNPTTNKGKLNNATIHFLGVPIFYLPYHEWTLKGRSSGFLLPDVGTYSESKDGSRGAQVKIPYYVNIAPDRDLLLTVHHLSTRGTALQGVYRQLISKTDHWQAGRLHLEGHYLNKDDITDHKRWLLKSKLDVSINNKTNLNLVTNRVSDVDYFEQIAHRNTSVSSLDSHINASYRDDKRDLSFSVFAQTQQRIEDDVNYYTCTPEVSISKGFMGLAGKHLNLSLVSTQFAHKDANEQTGLRTHLQADFKRIIRNNAYEFTPSLSLLKTHYNLDKTSDESRNIATLNLDAQLFLERNLTLFNTDLIQTLTPRLSYRYTPKKDQSNLPNFDTSFKQSYSYETLFSNQIFTGLDKISNANTVTLGVESDFFDTQAGDTYLNLKIAQAFYLDDEALNHQGALVKGRKYSNIVNSVDYSLGDWYFNHSLEFDPKDNIFDRQDHRIAYQQSPRKFLTLAYHNNNTEDDKSAEFYGVYPLNQKVHIFAGINRSITDSINQKQTAGIAYETCCWGLRFAYFKKNINGDRYDYVSSIELVLKGLASTSPSLSKRLAENIPNYLPNFH